MYTPTVNAACGRHRFTLWRRHRQISTCSKGIASIRIYSAPSVKAYTVNSNGLDTFLSLPSGTYSSTLQAWDKCGGVYKTPITVTAQNTHGHTLYMASNDLYYVSQYPIDDQGYLYPATFSGAAKWAAAGLRYRPVREHSPMPPWLSASRRSPSIAPPEVSSRYQGRLFRRW